MRHLILTAVATALGGLTAGLLGAATGIIAGVTPAVALRGLVALLLVFLACHLLAVRAVRAGAQRPALLVIAGALAGYLLDPLTWLGRTAATQLVAEPGRLTAIGDLACWLAVATAAAVLAVRRTPAPAVAPTVYG